MPTGPSEPAKASHLCVLLHTTSHTLVMFEDNVGLQLGYGYGKKNLNDVISFRGMYRIAAEDHFQCLLEP